VIVGAPAGEEHALPSAILSDLLRDDRFGVIDLGANTPPEAFAETARSADRLLAVCLGATGPGRDRALTAAVAAIKAAGVTAPVFTGGAAVTDASHAQRLGADGWTGANARAAVAAIAAVAPPVRASRVRSRQG
jgi:methylaspartate mutase sigma subunit